MYRANDPGRICGTGVKLTFGEKSRGVVCSVLYGNTKVIGMNILISEETSVDNRNVQHLLCITGKLAANEMKIYS